MSNDYIINKKVWKDETFGNDWSKKLGKVCKEQLYKETNFCNYTFQHLTKRDS